MFFDRSASSGEPSAPSRTNRILCQNFRQSFGELLIKCRNVRGSGHISIAFFQATDHIG